jgi:biopolymer transport protein ExbD
MSYFDVNIERTRKKPREISLVPMINVIFLMLIFFIVSGKIEHVHILPIDIPLSEQTSDVSLGEEIITLGKRDEILVGEDPIFTLEELEAWIKDRMEVNPAVRFTIKADADMSATILIEVMHLMERAGAHDVVLAAQQP